MTKAELTEKIIDAMIDPWNDDPNEYLCARPIDIHEATDILAQMLDDEDKMELEPEEKLPAEVTPELIMDTYNCLIRARKYAARTERLAKYITDNEMVCEYANYYYPHYDDAIDLFPVEFLDTNDVTLTTIDGTPMSSLDLIKLGQRSKMFHSDCEYCYYDQERDQLFSTDCPFYDGTLDAEAFARHVLCDAESLGYFIDDLMDDNAIKEVFGCTKEELLKEVM